MYVKTSSLDHRTKTNDNKFIDTYSGGVSKIGDIDKPNVMIRFWCQQLSRFYDIIKRQEDN